MSGPLTALHDRLPELPSRRNSLGTIVWNTALIVICLGGLADWLGAKTHRLYIDDDSERSRQVGSVSQHFALEGNKAVPQIITRDDA